MLLRPGVGVASIIIAQSQANSIAVYPSEMTDEIVKSTEQLTSEEYAVRVSPLGRLGNTEDMAGCVLWLASKAGAWLSGNVIVTDGGKLGVLPSSY